MPMLDVTIPAGALSPEAEGALLEQLTTLLLLHEGADPQNPATRSIAWAFVHRPADVFVGGTRTVRPHYRIVASVPEGQLDQPRREAITKAVTDAVLDAEAGAHPRDPSRVWVFTHEVPDGTWGGAGRVFRLADVMTSISGDRERSVQVAGERIAKSRSARA